MKNVISASIGHTRCSQKSGPVNIILYPYCGPRNTSTVSSVTVTAAVATNFTVSTAAEGPPRSHPAAAAREAAAQKRLDCTVK